MEQYYNHLTDRMEDLEPFMAKTLPRSRQEYITRILDRELEKPKYQDYIKEYPPTPSEAFPTNGDEINEGEPKYSLPISDRKVDESDFKEKPKYDMTYHTGQTAKDAITKAAKDYLDAHPEEVIKLRDEGLVQEMVDFAAKQNAELDPNAFNGAPTEEEVYLSKREREGRPPLIIWEDSGTFPIEETWEKLKATYKKEEDALDKSFNQLSDEAQDNLIKAIETIGNPLKEHPINKYDLDELKQPVGTPFEPSRYMMGNDPYGDADAKPYMYKKNEDGSFEYLRTPEDIINEDDDEDIIEFSFETISKWIIFGFIGIALGVILWFALT